MSACQQHFGSARCGLRSARPVPASVFDLGARSWTVIAAPWRPPDPRSPLSAVVRTRFLRPGRETGTMLCVEQLRRVTAEELDAMTPAERADVVTASICRSLDELDPEFRALLIERSDEFQRHLGADA